MRRGVFFVISVIIGLVAHVGVGWPFSIAGSFIAGWIVTDRRGVLAGALVLSTSWIIVIGYNFTVAAAETLEMTRVVASLLGDLPGFVTIIITIVIAAALGGLSGGLAGSIRRQFSK